jgi:MFS superfamily sulfate permease-like transporter
MGIVGIALFALASGGPIFAVLPLAALAATLLTVSVPRLIDVAGFLRLWRGWRAEALIALVTAVAVVGLGALNGLLVAVALAAAQLIRRSAYPQDAVLAVTSPDQPAHEIDEKQLPGSSVLIYRVDAPLLFINAGRVVERIRALAGACGPDLRYLILDTEAISYLDATAAETLAELTVNLRERGCQLLLARVRTPVLEALRANPYRQGATRDLPAFSGVRQAHAHAQQELELRRKAPGQDPQRSED